MLASLVSVPVTAFVAPVARPVVGSVTSAPTTPLPSPRWTCGSSSSRPRHGSGGVSGAATVGGLAAACVASRAVLRLVAGGAHSAWGRHRRRRGGRHSAAGVSRNVGRGVKDLLHGSTKLVESSYEERKKAREQKQVALIEDMLGRVDRDRSEAEERRKARETFIAAMKAKQEVLKKRVEEARAWRLVEVNLSLPGVEVKDTTRRVEEKFSSLPSSSSSSASPSTSLLAPKSRLAPWRSVLQFVRSATERRKAREIFIAAMRAKQEVLKKRVEEARAWRLVEVNLSLPGVEVKDTTRRVEEKFSSLPSSSSSSASPSTSLSAPKSKLAPCRLVFQFVRSATEAGIALVSGGSITSNKLSALN